MTYTANKKTINEVLKTPATKEFIYSLWYDWFCNTTSLQNKGLDLLKKLNQINKSKKFDSDKTYVFFKNCCPCDGSLYDRFNICDIETGEVIYCITPKSGHKADNSKGNVWGKENDFKGPLVEGSWKDIKNWFLEK